MVEGRTATHINTIACLVSSIHGSIGMPTEEEPWTGRSWGRRRLGGVLWTWPMGADGSRCRHGGPWEMSSVLQAHASGRRLQGLPLASDVPLAGDVASNF